MRKLTTMYHRGAADRLCQLLDAAGIDSEITVQEDNTYFRTSSIVVWVDDETAVADQVLKAFQAEPFPSTRVDKSDPDTAFCSACRYNLRGQVESGVCPECAHPYILLTPWICTHCNAENPSDFDICWKCEHENTPP